MDVDERQTKLAVWSQDSDFRFDDVFNLACHEDWLRRAYFSVKSNSGASTPGVDGQTMEDFSEDLEKNLKNLREELKSQSFDPKPVRRTYIPKGDGRERPLGIPTIKDRIVQEALRMVLEPIYETDFSDNSFGFRPNRCTMDAIRTVSAVLNPSFVSYMPWVLDVDIKGFFGNVDHQVLEQTIQDRITDQKFRDLIWDFLKAGVMEDGTTRHSALGTPQGGIVSPILANIYLNKLDQWVKNWTEENEVEKNRRQRRGKGAWKYVRYADDFLLLTNGRRKEAEEMLERVEGFVSEELNLTLSDKKTRIVHAESGFGFLGYRLEAGDGPEEGLHRKIPKEVEKDIKSKIRGATEGDTDVSARIKVIALNAMLRGWANYYRYATNASKIFNQLDHFTWKKVTGWLSGKYKCSRSELVNRKLTSSAPISINDATLITLSGRVENYTETWKENGHPYLDNKDLEREDFPDEDPWLGNDETVKGWGDARHYALERDEWKCQECGTDLEGQDAHVHHIRPKSGYTDHVEANRLGNLKSLCAECHREIESDRRLA